MEVAEDVGDEMVEAALVEEGVYVSVVVETVVVVAVDEDSIAVEPVLDTDG